MIKSQRKLFTVQLFGVIITLLILCAFNITYSYFSSVKDVGGTTSLYDLDVKYAYITSSSPVVVSQSTLVVYPTQTSGTIARGTSFKISVDGMTEIGALMFNVASGSCDCYIRFWIDAYAYVSGSADTSVNYGRYFTFTTTLSNLAREEKTSSGITNAVYYLTGSLAAGNTAFANGMKLLENAPTTMLDSSIIISIRFEAVQKANSAFMSVFNDDWGYYSDWV